MYCILCQKRQSWLSEILILIFIWNNFIGNGIKKSKKNQRSVRSKPRENIKLYIDCKSPKSVICTVIAQNAIDLGTV